MGEGAVAEACTAECDGVVAGFEIEEPVLAAGACVHGFGSTGLFIGDNDLRIGDGRTRCILNRTLYGGEG
jgi:hypothetical protein